MSLTATQVANLDLRTDLNYESDRGKYLVKYLGPKRKKSKKDTEDAFLVEIVAIDYHIDADLGDLIGDILTAYPNEVSLI